MTPLLVEPPWVVEARRLLGIKEIKGPLHQEEILQLWVDSKLSGIKNDEVPWCAAFTNACLERAGIRSPRKDSAKSYLDWGLKLDHPEPGCIAVFSRAGGNHVAFAIARDGGGDLVCIGGNQSDAVNISTFDRSRVIGYRWPTVYPMSNMGMLPPYSAAVARSTREA